MPLLQLRQLNNHTLLGIWALTETHQDLLQDLPGTVDISDIASAHPRRQNEWLASRILAHQLLRQFTNQPHTLERNQHGRPFFRDAAFHVSITHSPELAAVILSDKYEVGIDVELISGKALRVASKFLSEAEQSITANDEERTCLYWSAKETLYKLYSKKQLLFKENLLVAPSGHNILQGRVQTENFSKLYQVYHETIQNHVLTYSIDNTI